MMNNITQNIVNQSRPESRAVIERLPDERSSSFDIDFIEIWAAIYRSRYWIIGIILACFMVSAIYILLVKPEYQAVATVQIDLEAKKVLGTEESATPTSFQDNERFLNTQVDILMSRSVALAVAENLGIFEDKNFLKKMDESESLGDFDDLPVAEAKREKVLKVLSENLSANLPIDSRVVKIGFTSPDPVLAARVANGFSENFIRSNLQRKFDTSSYARDFLSDQLKAVQARLEKSERDVVAYTRRTSIIDTTNAATGDSTTGTEVQAPRSLTTATLVLLNQKYSESLARRVDAEEKWKRVRNASLLSIPEVVGNDAVQRLVQQRAELVAAYEEERERRKEDFPTVRQAAARIAEFNSQINSLGSQIRASIRSDYEIARAQEQSFKQQLEVLKSSTINEQSAAIELSILRRESVTNRDQYEFLLKRYNDLNAEAGVQSNNLLLIDRASTPVKPFSPNIPLILAFATIASVLLSALFTFARTQLFETVRTPEDVERRLGLALLGAIPRAVDNENIMELIQDSKSEISEALSSVRTALSLASSHGLPRTLAFTSTQAGEGKSVTCQAMAQTLGRTGKKVLVIDLDMRRPNQHKLSELPNNAGMSDLLVGARAAGEVMHATGHANVTLITAGPIPPNPTELLQSENLTNVLRQFENDFDIVLVDGPPVLGLADAIIIGSLVEGLVFVVESGRNHSKGAKAALRRLQQGGVHVIGAILSRFNPTSAGYSYAYAYQYDYRKSGTKD
jgi:capsular exopolysaccharide synthesis family protein